METWRKIFVTLLMLVFIPVSVYAFQPEDWVDQTTTRTATAPVAMITGAGWLYGMAIVTDGTNNVTWDFYDGTSTSEGIYLLPSSLVITTSASNRLTTISFSDTPLGYNTGVYVVPTTSGSIRYMLYYREK